MRNGDTVRAFEDAFGQYVGAKYAIALNSGTSTLHTALLALGVKPGDRVAVPPLTMSATAMSVLHAGAVPVFCDVAPDTWLMKGPGYQWEGVRMPVSLYGLHAQSHCEPMIDDAAQTLRPFSRSREYGHVTGSYAAFTSYSFQASKILSTGEGGMLVTDSEELATRARSISSLGYKMDAKQPRIDPATLKSPTFDRHHTFPSWNYRMADVVAQKGLDALDGIHWRKAERHDCANLYRDAHEGCAWVAPQFVPEGWEHDMWTYAIACDTPERAVWLADAVVRHGGERPYAAWKLTYHEPAFRHLIDGSPYTNPGVVSWSGVCPIAESLQPRLLQFQTNDLASAERNARALRHAIREAA